MCKNRPCWPTPEESKKIVEAGFGNRLMIDFWAADALHPKNVKMRVPAIVGYEDGEAPGWPQGTCTFLKDGKCELHPLGLKPLEGRVASCEQTPEAAQNSRNVRQFIVSEWEKVQHQFD